MTEEEIHNEKVHMAITDKMGDRMDSLGVTVPMMIAANARASFDYKFSVKDGTWGGVIDVYSDAVTVLGMIEGGVSCDTDGIDFMALATLLREAADAYEAVSKRIAN